VSLLFTVPVALLAARRPGGIFDRVSMAVSMIGLSTAPYVLALVLVFVFAVELDVLPSIGFVAIGDGLLLNLKSLILPATSIGFPLFCFYTRLLRADILDKMQGEDYVVTAQAKGVGPWRVLLRHALPNSLFGLLTLVALNFGTLVGVTVIIESIFALPGIGQALLQAINNRDVLVVEAIVLALATVVVLANLVADLLYLVLDPRIRYERAAS
jgi:peptide/nickel transport system permease protein